MLARRGVSVFQIAALAGWKITHTQRIIESYVPLDEHMTTATIRPWAASESA